MSLSAELRPKMMQAAVAEVKERQKAGTDEKTEEVVSSYK